MLGFTNYETWNICFWIRHDEELYTIARQCANYQDFVETINFCGPFQTPTAVSWYDHNINIDEVNDICFAEDADDFIPRDCP